MRRPPQFIFESDHLEEFVLVRVERAMGTEIIFDFIESNNFNAFTSVVNGNMSVEGATMILLKNYHGRKVREGVIYIITRKIIDQIAERIQPFKDSLIILFEIDLAGFDAQFFEASVSEASLEWPRNVNLSYSFHAASRVFNPELLVNFSGRMRVIVRNIGQGNWNEILLDDKIKLVYDIGTAHQTKASQLPGFLGNREIQYRSDKPGLIISHWDVDHYHFMRALSDTTIQSFAFILCRDYQPTAMSRVIYARLERLCGNLITLASDRRAHPHTEVPLFEIFNCNDKLFLFNSASSRNRNKDGISVLVRNLRSSVLLSGDQHYRQFNDFILRQYLNYRHIHHLIVPHHGGHAGKFIYDLSSLVKTGRCIVSVGKNSYGHPFKQIIKNLNDLAFKVSETRIVGADIELDL